MLAGCVLFGAMPINVIFIVNPWLGWSQLIVAAPSGICLRIALAVVPWDELDDKGAVVPDEA